MRPVAYALGADVSGTTSVKLTGVVNFLNGGANGTSKSIEPRDPTRFTPCSAGLHWMRTAVYPVTGVS